MSTRWARPLAVIVAAVTGVVLADALHLSHGDFDVRIYRGAVLSWFHGGDLYAFGLGPNHLGFTYPPFAAVLMAPLAVVPQGTAVLLNKVLIVLALGFSVWQCVRVLPHLRAHGELFVVGLVLPAALVLQPVRDTFTFGQVNIYLAALVLLDLRLLRVGSAWAGVGIGLAAAIKLTPGLFVLFLLVAGLRRPAVVAFFTAAGATLLAAVIAPRSSWTFWTDALFDTSRVGSTDSATNQSLAGLLARLADARSAPVIWLPLVLLAVGFGLWAARLLWQRERYLAGFTVVGITSALASPISWVHHLWWVVPALLVLAEEALARRSRAWALATLGLFVLWASGVNDRTRAPAGQHHGWPALLGENAYVLCLIALVVGLPLLLRERFRAGDRALTAVHP
jgi:alpha-1,2-mannosyltransferase